MRLIDADKVIDIVAENISKVAVGKTVLAEFIKLINKQPTVYDVDKVVEDIKQIKFEHFLTIANTNNEALDVTYEKVGNALDKAVEIVKSGGMVSDMENLDVRR